MGRDKALVLVDGTAMAARVAGAAVTAGADPVLAVGGDQAGLEAAGIAYCPDRWPGEGPLGGVITALSAMKAESTVAILACDLLHPDPVLIAELVDRRRATDADVTVAVDDGHRQWTHAAWHARAVAPLEAVFRDGVRSLHQAVKDLTVVPVVVAGGATADADRPEDLPGCEPPQ